MKTGDEENKDGDAADNIGSPSKNKKTETEEDDDDEEEDAVKKSHQKNQPQPKSSQ
jgi:hypothetical protein